MTGMVGLARKDIKITVQHFPYRKKPVLAVEIGNCSYKVASFNSEETADWFIKIAEEFFGNDCRREK